MEIMKYKMLVLDLDDTLLNDDLQISKKNKTKLIEAQRKGIYVVLASGRPTQAMLQFAKELQLDKYNSFVISYNGAIITDVSKNLVIFEQSLTKDEIHELHSFSKNNQLHILTYKDNKIISDTESEYINVERDLTGLPIHKVSNFKKEMNQPAVKCILLDHPERLKRFEPVLKDQKKNLSVAISKPFFLEVMPKGVDKGASIQRLAKKLNIKQGEVIAVGNAHNDLSMVEFAGLGIWVDNVNPELRDKADYIVASNNDDGVAEVVDKFLLNTL